MSPKRKMIPSITKSLANLFLRVPSLDLNQHPLTLFEMVRSAERVVVRFRDVVAGTILEVVH